MLFLGEMRETCGLMKQTDPIREGASVGCFHADSGPSYPGARCQQHDGKNPGVRVQRLLSNTLWTPFDNTERRLTGRERHVVRDYWLRQPFKGQRTDFFESRCPFDRHGNALAKQYLSVLGLGTQPGGDIADGANCGVARPLGKADLPQRRIALRDASAKAEFAPAP